MKKLTRTFGLLIIGLLMFSTGDISAQGKSKEKGKANKEMVKKQKDVRDGNDKMKKEIKAIENDPALSEEEKVVRIKEIKDAYKSTKPKRGKKGKGKKKKMKEAKAKMNKAERASERGNISPEKRKRALRGLDQAEKSLSKMLDKGKISQEHYDARLAKINEIRAKVGA